MDYFALDLESKYRHLCAEQSDINDALPTLRKYASQCRRVTEFGVRTAVSTTALLVAQPDVLTCYDLELNTQFISDLMRMKGRTQFNVWKGDTRTIDIEPTDLLFIDTCHQYRQLKTELDRHSGKVTRFIILHDTTIYRNVDEGDSPPGPKGLWPAVEEFVLREPWWEVCEQIVSGSGLTVMKRGAL